PAASALTSVALRRSTAVTTIGGVCSTDRNRAISEKLCGSPSSRSDARSVLCAATEAAAQLTRCRRIGRQKLRNAGKAGVEPMQERQEREGQRLDRLASVLVHEDDRAG